MKIPYYRVSFGFARLSNVALAAFCEYLISKLEGNASFPDLTVSIADLKAALATLQKAMAEAAAGSLVAIAARRAARETLLGLLRQNASYVQSVAGEDLAMLLSSGYEAVSTNRSQITLPKPAVRRIENIATTELALRVTAVPTARSYEVRMRTGTNPWQNAGVFTQSRGMVIPNLTPGTLYEFQVRAIGGNTGCSDWSDTMSHMAI